MKNLTENKEAVELVQEYFLQKRIADESAAKAKEILTELSRLSDGEPAQIGNHKLNLVNRAGSVSYAAIVKAKLPDLDLEPYRGAPSAYYTLK